jgi:hypothetical protein
MHPMTIENIDFIVDKITFEEVLLPSGEICDLLKKQLDNFRHLNSQTRLERLKI